MESRSKVRIDARQYGNVIDRFPFANVRSSSINLLEKNKTKGCHEVKPLTWFYFQSGLILIYINIRNLLEFSAFFGCCCWRGAHVVNWCDKRPENVTNNNTVSCRITLLISLLLDTHSTKRRRSWVLQLGNQYRPSYRPHILHVKGENVYNGPSAPPGTAKTKVEKK